MTATSRSSARRVACTKSVRVRFRVRAKRVPLARAGAPTDARRIIVPPPPPSAPRSQSTRSRRSSPWESRPSASEGSGQRVRRDAEEDSGAERARSRADRRTRDAPTPRERCEGRDLTDTSPGAPRTPSTPTPAGQARGPVRHHAHVQDHQVHRPGAPRANDVRAPPDPRPPPPDRDPRSHVTRPTSSKRTHGPNPNAPPPLAADPWRLAAPAAGAFPSARTAARTHRSFPP